jgi:hypothetical protein
VPADVRLGRRSDDWARELVVLLEPIWQSDSTDDTDAFLVSSPSTAWSE